MQNHASMAFPCAWRNARRRARVGGMNSWLAGLCSVLFASLGLSAQTQPSAEGEAAPSAGEQRLLDSPSLRSISFDLLGRPPYALERERWIGKPLGAFVEDCLTGEEFWSSWVEEQLYYFLLIDNFRPHSKRVLDLPRALHAGKLQPHEALHVISLCPSFDRRNPGPDTFVTVIMEQLLGLEVQKKTGDLEAGKRIYDGHGSRFLGVQGDSQSDVVRIAIEDRRSRSHLLSREYQRLVRKPAPKRELSAWTRSLESGELDYLELLGGWLRSEAYAQRLAQREPMTNRIFVQALFVDLSDSKPGLEEARRLRNALDGLSSAGPLRSVLARLYVDSGRVKHKSRSAIEDPTQWISGLFVRLLGRPPSPEELGVFVGSFHNPACTPATVIYALISHPEYQTW